MVTKVTTDVLADGAVQSNNIANLTITGSKIANGTITATQLASNAITGSVIANNSIDGTKIALGSDTRGDIMYYNGTDWARLPAGTSGYFLQTQGTTADPTWSVGSTTVFSKSYTSTNQTITATGLLTLAHGLGTAPLMMRFTLVCVNANAGYAIGDVIQVTPGITSSSVANTGFGAYADATNVYIRFGSLATNTIYYQNKGTGVETALTNTAWQLVVRAWA